MKKSILLILLLLFSCVGDDPVTPKEEIEKDTTKALDTSRTEDLLFPEDSVGVRPISKEMADTIMVVDLLKGETWGDNKDTIFHNLKIYNDTNTDGSNWIECDNLGRETDLRLANDTIFIEVGLYENQQDTAIILKNDSWIYFYTNTGINCPNQDIIILDAITREIKKYWAPCENYELKDGLEREDVLSKFLNKK